MKLISQISSWNTYHQVIENKEYFVIQIFGRTASGKDVILKVTDFQPFFFIKISRRLNEKFIERMMDSIHWQIRQKSISKLGKDITEEFVDYEIVKQKKFQGFTLDKKYKYLKLNFTSDTAKKFYANKFAYPITLKNFFHEPKQFTRWQSNLESVLQFIHYSKIKPCHWIEIDTNDAIKLKKYSNCDYTYEVNYKDVHLTERSDMAPFEILAYDLECISSDENFPQASRPGDKIIQIGMTFSKLNIMECHYQHILTLGNCKDIEGATVECFEREVDMIRRWAEVIRERRPDFITGYNTFCFDDEYIYKRILVIDQRRNERRGFEADFEDTFEFEILSTLGKTNYEYLNEKEGNVTPHTYYRKLNIGSSALGNNEWYFFNIPGIVAIDVLKSIQRDYQLSSYTLDSVAAFFINEKIMKIIEIKPEEESVFIKFTTGNIKGIDKNSYIQIMIQDSYSSTPLREKRKFQVDDIGKYEEDGKTYPTIGIYMAKDELDELLMHQSTAGIKILWTFAKDLMHHSVINSSYKNRNLKEFTRVAKYCLQDCKLVNILMTKLDILVKNIAMGNVCYIPLSYLFYRGQGIKLFSLVSRYCSERGYLIPTRGQVNEDGEKYEGAIVFEPIPGFYTDPIAVNDFNSLYPNSMRECNLSHEYLVTKDKYKKLEGYHYHYIEINLRDGNGDYIEKDGKIITKTRCFAQKIMKRDDIVNELKKMSPDLEDAKMEDEIMKYYNKVNGQYVAYGIIPAVLTQLLNERKIANAKLAAEQDPFKKMMLHYQQLSLKLVANSLYGQCGSIVSPISCVEIAEFTTAIGRKRLAKAKQLVESHFQGAKVIYGDTDSIFTNFNLRDDKGNNLPHREALIKTIELGQKAASLINGDAPTPQRIVYEKTLFPLILIGKKKYVAPLYEFSPDKWFLKPMGIVLKRRDNAPIVKIVVGGIIDNLIKMTEKNLENAVEYVKKILINIFDNKYSIDKFILSKTLKGNYSNPKQIAHKVLADRIGARDPGNKPHLNDRIQFVYIVKEHHKNDNILQGDLIETPEFIQQHNLKIDYLYYIEHQIIKPASQILELLMSKETIGQIFDHFINKEISRRMGRQDIRQWFENTAATVTDDFKVIIKESNIGTEKPAPMKLDKWTDNSIYIPKNKKSKKKKVPGKKISLDQWMK